MAAVYEEVQNTIGELEGNTELLPDFVVIHGEELTSWGPPVIRYLVYPPVFPPEPRQPLALVDHESALVESTGVILFVLGAGWPLVASREVPIEGVVQWPKLPRPVAFHPPLLFLLAQE